MLKPIALTALLLAAIPISEARALTFCPLDGTYRTSCFQGETRTATRTTPSRSYRTAEEATIIGGRPSGCPHRYCGCALARYLGINDKRLNRAWNWAKLFPRASAGPGMAVVWRGHVAMIEHMVSDKEAMLRDYNSGRGLSRLHVRSIRGAVIVNPSRRLAMGE